MIYHTSLLLLGPVLFLQGKYVRRVTPVLPEAVGERFGCSGQGRPLKLLIAGDSAAAGVGVDQLDESLVGNVVSTLSATCAVHWKVMAESGDSSRQLLEKLQAAPAESFDIVVVSIGVNDVTALTSSSSWLENLEQIVELLVHKFDARRVYLSSIPPMHHFPALPNPLRWWLGMRARRFNQLMQIFSEKCEGREFVEIPYSDDQSLIARDGFHPGAPAYKLWGEHVAQLISQSLNHETHA